MTDSIRVLHVDDEPNFAEMAAEFLEGEDSRLDVVTATNAVEGYELLDDHDIDCVVSDFDMPGRNGIRFLGDVREEYLDLPFILFTGKGSEEVASEAISAGATDYLQKEGGTEQYTILANRVLNYVDTAKAKSQRKRQLDAIEAAKEGISILDENGEFAYVNEAYADLYGYEREEMIGEHWQMLYPEAEVPRIRDEVLPSVEANGGWSGRTTGLRADGATFVEDHTLATTDDGELVCTVRDQTESKERGAALAALHDAATDLESANDEAAVYDILVDAAQGILDFDLVAVDVYEDEALVQRSMSLELDTEGYWEVTPITDDTFATRAYKRQETIVVGDLRDPEITPADPEYRSALTAPIADIGTFQAVSRQETAFDETDRELTELLVGHAREALTRLETERRLRERTEELERQNQRLEEFATIVSHDLRAPLNVAEGRLELAAETCDSDNLRDVGNALDRMDTLIEDTLTLAREGQMVTERESVAVGDVVDRCWERVASSDADLAVEDDFAVSVDPDRLQQMFENLFRNAVEHGSTSPDSQARRNAVEHGSTNPRSPTHEDAVEHGSTGSQTAAEDTNTADDADTADGVSVRVGELADGFYVADDGPGVPEDERAEVFERGYTTSDDGTGFGLAIVHEIVSAHGWDIVVTDSDEGGARFEVSSVELASGEEP